MDSDTYEDKLAQDGIFNHDWRYKQKYVFWKSEADRYRRELEFATWRNVDTILHLDLMKRRSVEPGKETQGLRQALELLEFYKGQIGNQILLAVYDRVIAEAEGLMEKWDALEDNEE